MQGSSLAAARSARVEATQLTSGDGYDYQPDWSRDGRHVVYASYRNDAIELWLLDLTTGATRPIVANGAVNVDPRWSPDGSAAGVRVDVARRPLARLRRADVTSGQIGAPVRVTEDHDSGLPRYYYSVWDHYLSPSWSPDGRELTFVSNRGHVWGTGGFWRMAAAPGATAREIHYEETTWKARPDWSPDGQAAWSTAAILDGSGTSCGSCPPVAATPSSSRTATSTPPRRAGRLTARAIAFISNQDGNTSLWVLTVPGGSRARVDATKRLYRAPVGTLRLRCAAMAAAPRCPRASRCSTPQARATRQTMRGAMPTRPSSEASGASSTAISTRTARQHSRCRQVSTSSRRRAGRSSPSHAASCASSLTTPTEQDLVLESHSPTCRRAAGGAAICTCT